MFTLPTGRRGQALALALTVLALAAVWIGVVSPIRQWYDDRAELLRRQTAIAHRMRMLVEGLPALRREAAAIKGNAASGETPATLLQGASDPLAAASLQQRVEELAAKSGLRLASEEILPAQTEGDSRAISVRLTATAAPYQATVAFLLALARSELPIVVDDMLLRGSQLKATANDAPVEASLTVTSWRAVKPDVKPEAAAR